MVSFKELLRKIQGLKIAIYEKELAEQKAELEYTQEQIKPHFFSELPESDSWHCR